MPDLSRIPRRGIEEISRRTYRGIEDIEEDGFVTERYKYIRPDFLTAVVAAEGHWLNRPIVPNMLIEGVDLFDVA